MKVVRSRRAIRDLDDIWSYIASNNPSAADRLVTRLVNATSRLSDYPESAPLEPDAGPGIRGVPCHPYTIYYRVGPDSVDILRIIHNARDIRSVLR